MEVIVQAKDLRKYFQIERGFLRKRMGFIKAVDGVSLEIRKGEVLGLVGESGCGKTTVAKLLLNLIKPDEGKVRIGGVDVSEKYGARDLKKKAQIIFQDPYGSLNPRMKVKDIILEGVDIFKLYSRDAKEKRLKELLNVVGLPYYAKDKYPHQFSGGERQRIGVARALSVEPEFIVCDEPVSSLDISIRAQILNLLKDLQENFSLSYLFISHDLNVVRYISDRIAVMYKGKIVEEAESSKLYDEPYHPYTRYLLSANLSAKPSQRFKRLVYEVVEKEVKDEKKGCVFYSSCPVSRDICQEVSPPLKEVAPSHYVACHFIRGNPLRDK